MKATIVPFLLVVFASFPTGYAQEYSTSQTVAETLATECFSKIDRATEIAPERAKDPSPAEWWQSGFVEHEGDWVRFDEAIRQTRNSSFQSKYNGLAKDSPNRHLELARLCLKYKRKDQYRAHMLAAATTNPRLLDEKTLRRMGFRNTYGSWLTPEETYRILKKYRDFERSFQLFGDQLLAIQSGLNGGPTQRNSAERELRQIDSPAAVDAIYHILMNGDAKCQREAVNSLAKIDSARSTVLLAECGLFSPLKSVRDTAFEALRARPKETYVPPVLDLLATIHEGPVLSSGGTVFTGVTFKSKTFAETRHAVRVRTDLLHVSFHKVVMVDDPEAGGNPDFRAVGQLMTPLGRTRIATSPGVRNWIIGNQNRAALAREISQARNRPAIRLLSATTGKDFTSPTSWWSWWNGYTDVEASVKEVTEVESDFDSARMGAFISTSCFAASTKVVTELGPQPIENLRVGDKVLSQDIDTGELSFQVVRQTTIRPPRATHIVSVGQESIRCTGGHNFWKAGTGWVKARDLEVGDRIRTPTGTEAVTAVAKGEPVKTYNLVVEGFHTYFVGDSKLLVQDVLPITPTDNVLPGFSKFALGDDAPTSDRSE